MAIPERWLIIYICSDFHSKKDGSQLAKLVQNQNAAGFKLRTGDNWDLGHDKYNYKFITNKA